MRVTEVIEDPIMQILTLETLLADAAFESIPESIIQIDGLLKQNYEDIQTIQIIGVISSIVSGAFITTDGSFGFNLSKFLASAGDPCYGWISKIGGWEKRRQM